MHLAHGLRIVPALADAGVPMIFLAFPLTLMVLIPVIVVESVVGRRVLRLPWSRIFKVFGAVNLVSMLVGIPLTWFVLAMVQAGTGGGGAMDETSPIRRILAVTWQAPWLLPDERNLYWKIPAAILFLLIPFFLVSWFVEYVLAKVWLKGTEKTLVNRAVLRANLASYGMLFAGTAIWLIMAKPTP